MSKTAVRRETIFNRYSQNLHFLVDHGFIKKLDLQYAETYICPICKRQFSKNDLNQNLPNPLTLEDAPPKRLGGTSNVLTCKECNNTLGREIDSHLVNNFIQKDLSKFQANSTFDAYMTNPEGLKVKSHVRINDLGVIKALQSKLNNKPGLTEAFNDLITTDPTSPIFIQPDFVEIKKEKVEIAFLKTAYLLMFKKFGYLFLFEDVYKRIQNQLQDISTPLYDFDGWYQVSKKELLADDVYYVRESNMKCWMVCFTLKTPHSTRYVRILLPFILPVQYMLMGFVDINEHYKQKINLQNLGKTSFSDYQTVLSMSKVLFEQEHLTNLSKIVEYFDSYQALKKE